MSDADFHSQSREGYRAILTALSAGEHQGRALAEVKALHRIRGGGRQSIEVGRVHTKNAVIGHVMGAGGGAAEIGNQPLAKPIDDASVAALRGQVEADRQALLVAQGDGSNPLPDARRRGRKRRTER